MSLFWRSFLVNAFTITAALLVLLATPATAVYPVSVSEVVVVVASVGCAFLLNFLLTRRILLPLARLRAAIDAVHEPDTASRVPIEGNDEVAELAKAYNAMLSRLDDERAEAMRQTVAAQEQERARVSTELHDEVGQTLTALLLRMSVLAQNAPGDLRSELEASVESVRGALDEVRGISARLRPGSLRDLGLVAAIRGLSSEVAESAGISVELNLPAECVLPEELELVIYRVAQEALTNVAKHARADRAWVQLTCSATTVGLRVRDDGVGTTGPPGTGHWGMAERTRVARGTLDVDSRPGVGTTVALTIPLLESSPA